MKRYKHTTESLVEAVADSSSIREVLLKLGMAGKGGNYETIKARLEKENIDISHFTGMGWRKNKTFPEERRKIDNILVENSVYASGAAYGSYSVKMMLLSNGMKNNKCEECGLEDWHHKEIKLELHHVNGNRKDNRIENLQILCPNCHSQTSNFRGKNKQ